VNRATRRVAVALGILFVALFVNLNVVQVVQGGSLRDNPDNRRVLLNEYSHPRGPIVASGNSIALSKETNDELKYLRRYPEGPIFAPVTGYDSFTYGLSGMEDAENGILSGDDARLFTSNLSDILTGRNPQGGTVVLTINKAAQEAAYHAMGNRSGAVVALNPRTGAILAAVSTPSYDPNALSSHDSGAIARAYSCYVELDTARRAHETSAQFRHRIHAQLRSRRQRCRNVPDDPTAYFSKNPYAVSPLVDRAFRELYPSGSIFKIIDSAAALGQGTYTPTKSIPAPNSYWPLRPTRTAACSTGSSIKTGPCMENFDGETCENGKTATLAYAFAKSCNTAFAELANQLGGDAIAAEAHKFGLDRPYPGQGPPDFCDPPAFSTPLPVCRSSPGSQQDLQEPDTLAQTAIGQHDVGVTPVQAAMLAAAVANNGTLMQPYLVQKELGPNLSPLPVPHGKQLSQVLDPNTDQQLISMMQGVVTSPEGTGHIPQLTNFPSGISVGGKTGTADHCATNGPNCPQPHAWFTGFAFDKGVPKIAVAVIIENGGVNGNETTGGLAAGPVAAKVMSAYLSSPAGS
jgi:peptidoglycan glycosyltransferase